VDAIEKAIRSAFAKGDPRERAFREKVYRSAFAALDKAISANPGMAPEMVDLRRRHLTARISDIESEFIPAVPSVDQPSPPAGARQTPPPAAPSPRIEPEPVIDRDDMLQEAPSDRYADAYDVEAPEGEYAKPPRRGRPWAAALIGVLLLCAGIMGAWWAIDSGFFKTPAERDGSVPNPPQVLEDEDFDPDRPAEPPLLPGGPDDLADWIVVFDPTDPTTVTAPGDSSAEVMDADGEPFIRIGAGASGSPVLFDVGQGVLEQLAGRRAVFNIVAERPEDGETQIAVDCNLAELGDCGRKRYVVGVTREEFLFEVDLPPIDPGAGGTIAINPDVESGGKTVDIYAIRVSPVE
jgi:hypothetical protein